MNKNQALPWDNPRFKNWIAVARASQLIHQKLGRALTQLDIKVPHLDILANLYRFEGISQQDLAHKLLVGRSNISMLLPQIEKRGLIVRRKDETDKRVLRLYLTERGREVTLRALAIELELIEHSMSTTSIEECNFVGDVMNRMVQRMDDWEVHRQLVADES
ncbi:MAG: MarR family transcriptional regulator [Hyphomicrobiales bacterium]|nr:MarR family transcriptional regulator [Hyphomicrobiales bacterium]MCP4998196.1 MarR family transcriptional regulator [Hyphomicrobiales bacterium]